MQHRAEDVLAFWFTEHGPDDWFAGDAEFDRLLVGRFAALHASVSQSEAFAWRATPEGRLAEIIVLDQFSRQIHRGSPQAFAQDRMALALAQEAVAGGHDKALTPEGRMFLLMPYMHSESLPIHEEAMRLFGELGNPEVLDYEREHRDAIARFGRYPFRNRVLGRSSTPEEEDYMREHADRGF